jgi:hypothetical protein
MNRRKILLALGLLPLAAHAAKKGPRIVVYKSESCGCCKLWVQHLLSNGFEAEVFNVDNLQPVKERVGVPFGKGSCHTGEIEGYLIEGHVPAADIKRLLRERPAAKGLTVPGMPAGSPGMEVPSGQVDTFETLLVAKDGSTSVYARHGG